MKFDYFKPQTMQVLWDNVNGLDKVSYLAGGTDLIVKSKNEVLSPSNMVDLQLLDELKGIKEDNDVIVIGAMETHANVHKCSLIKEYASALADASSRVGAVQIRNMGTVGGNICNASPAADSVPAFMALDAQITLESPQGERTIALKDFFILPSRPLINDKEVLKTITIKKCGKQEGTGFVKIGKRKAMAISVINGAAYLKVENGVITDARVVLGSIAAKTVHIAQAEEFLIGKQPTAENFKQAGEIAASSIKPITDVRSTEEYRVDSSKIVVKRALEAAYENVEAKA